MSSIRLILNGKKAGLEPVRSAIYEARNNADIDVRVTWESGDVARFVNEAMKEGVHRLIIGGGDGSVNEIVDALMSYPIEIRPEIAILPLGTANDFATACTIPTDFLAALHLAQNGKAFLIDCAKANDHHFINVASGGFGAQVTTNTPVELKNFLGGGAYTINGLIQSLNFKPYEGVLRVADQEENHSIVVGAICNGVQAGGGQILAPDALLDDGLLDIFSIQAFPKESALQVIHEFRDPTIDGQFVKRFKAPWLEWESDQPVPTNLDGEPISAKKIRYEVLPKQIKLVLPYDCPILVANQSTQ